MNTLKYLFLNKIKIYFHLNFLENLSKLSFYPKVFCDSFNVKPIPHFILQHYLINLIKYSSFSIPALTAA